MADLGSCRDTGRGLISSCFTGDRLGDLWAASGDLLGDLAVSGLVSDCLGVSRPGWGQGPGSGAGGCRWCSSWPGRGRGSSALQT